MATDDDKKKEERTGTSNFDSRDQTLFNDHAKIRIFVWQKGWKEPQSVPFVCPRQKGVPCVVAVKHRMFFRIGIVNRHKTEKLECKLFRGHEEIGNSVIAAGGFGPLPMGATPTSNLVKFREKDFKPTKEKPLGWNMAVETKIGNEAKLIIFQVSTPFKREQPKVMMEDLPVPEDPQDLDGLTPEMRAFLKESVKEYQAEMIRKMKEHDKEKLDKSLQEVRAQAVVDGADIEVRDRETGAVIEN
jgi:hypothetical protein